MKQLKKITFVSIKFLLLMTVLLGVIYSLSLTAIGQTIFPHTTNGSQINITLKDGTVKSFGSELIGQVFTDKSYFIGRPTSTNSYAFKSTEQQAEVDKQIAWWRNFDPQNTNPIPSDLIYASASGVDPYISVESAMFQKQRIATERNLTIAEVTELIHQATESKTLGIFGEERVHVLKLNLMLDGYAV